MRSRSTDILFSRRGLIAGAAGLVVAHAARADLTVTPRQTTGPFYPRSKPADSDADLTRVQGRSGVAEGEVIEVQGRVLSLKDDSLHGAVVEIWQADSHGRYRHVGDGTARSSRDDDFQGYGAVRVGSDGAYRFRTIRPRYYGSGRGMRTPHIHFRIVEAGGRELVTQMYFPGEPRNARDGLYQSLASDAARAAVTARREGGDVVRYLFDIVVA